MQRIVYKTITRFGEGEVRDMIEGNIEVWGEGGEGEKTPIQSLLNGRKMTSVSEKQYFIHIVRVISVFEIKT